MDDHKAQLAIARGFLAEHHDGYYTPDKVKDLCGLTMSISTLAPKMRLWARNGRLDRAYMMNESGQRLAYYCWNHAYDNPVNNAEEVVNHNPEQDKEPIQ